VDTPYFRSSARTPISLEDIIAHQDRLGADMFTNQLLADGVRKVWAMRQPFLHRACKSPAGRVAVHVIASGLVLGLFAGVITYAEYRYSSWTDRVIEERTREHKLSTHESLEAWAGECIRAQNEGAKSAAYYCSRAVNIFETATRQRPVLGGKGIVENERYRAMLLLGRAGARQAERKMQNLGAEPVSVLGLDTLRGSYGWAKAGLVALFVLIELAVFAAINREGRKSDQSN